MIFPGFPGILSFFQVSLVEWEPWGYHLVLPFVERVWLGRTDGECRRTSCWQDALGTGTGTDGRRAAWRGRRPPPEPLGRSLHPTSWSTNKMSTTVNNIAVPCLGRVHNYLLATGSSSSSDILKDQMCRQQNSKFDAKCEQGFTASETLNLVCYHKFLSLQVVRRETFNNRWNSPSKWPSKMVILMASEEVLLPFYPTKAPSTFHTMLNFDDDFHGHRHNVIKCNCSDFGRK